jgi:hypothetical protein
VRVLAQQDDSLRGPKGYITKDALLAIKESAPSRPGVTRDGKPCRIISLGVADRGLHTPDGLEGCGLLSLPLAGGAEITVKTVSAPGNLVSPQKPLKLVTDESGRASFVLRSGSHPGIVKLLFEVQKNPAGVDIKPRAELEIAVHPSLKTPEPEKMVPPNLAYAPTMLLIQAEVYEPEASVFHGRLMIGPEGIEALEVGPTPSGGVATPDRTSLPGWELTGGAGMGFVGRERVMTFSSPGEAIWQSVTAGGDFALSFRYRTEGGAGDVILCRSGEGARVQEYVLTLGPDQVELKTKSGDRVWVPGTAAHVIQPGEWHNVRIVFSQAQVKVVIAGEAVLQAQLRRPLPAGAIGFACVDGSCAFDDVSLEPGGGG